jgi:hypothetical protein
MGLMRFVLPPDRISEETVQQTYLSGMDRVPWPARIRQGDGELVIERAVSDSGNLCLPWPVEGHGLVALSTGTLMERPDPYHLPLELARGKIGQVRNQLADWRMIGLLIPAEVQQKVADATVQLSRSAVEPQGGSASIEQAELAIRTALDAAHLLASCYTEQALSIRRRNAAKLNSFLGANLGVSLLDDYTAREFLQTFNAGGVPVCWREVETGEETFSWDIADRQVQWCATHGLGVCAGPLLQLDARGIPDWLSLYEEDFDSVLAFATAFVEAAVTRYRGKVDLWICASRINTAKILSLTEEENVRLSARAVELTRDLDPDTPVVVSFDQPWGEYLGRKEMEFPPLHFADALVRANLGLSGVMLEMNVGSAPGATPLRDPLELSRHLDYWSVLGVPLYLSLCVPSESHADPLALRQSRTAAGGWSPKSQQAWVQRYVPLLLAKPYVQGILWNQLRDAEPHDFPHGGLFDLRRHPKPALRLLASIRTAHLK